MPSLRQRMTEDMQVRNLSPHTRDSYVQQVSLFARHFSKSPEALGPEEIRSYQVYLTNEKKLAPGSIQIAVAALRFLYRVTLHKDWTFADVIPAPKKPQTLPIVLSSEEVVKRNPGCILGHTGHQSALTPAQIGQRPGWDHITAVKQNCIRLLNGDTVARPGPRLAEALEAITRALYPDLLP